MDENVLAPPVDAAILAVSMVAVLLAVTMLAGGEVFALVPLLIGLLGFAYLKVDADRIYGWFSSENSSGTDPAEEALTVLRQRYARGEIDQEEFERRLNDLLQTETLEQAEEHHERAIHKEQP